MLLPEPGNNIIERSSANGSHGSRVSDRDRSDCGDCDVRGARPPGEARGLAWVIGAFVICPCHLPITLAVAAVLLGGTSAGLVLRTHPIAAGALITLMWAAATWHGFRLMEKARR